MLEKDNWNCSPIKHKACICTVWRGESYRGTADRQTDVYGPLRPKIDSDKYADEYFMAAMPEMSELRGMVNLTRLMHCKRQMKDTLSFLPQAHQVTV